MKNKAVTVLALAVIVIILCVLCGGTYTIAYDMPSEYTSLQLDTVVEYSGYTISGDKVFTPTGDDPQFYLSLPQQSTSSMRLVFASPLPQETKLQVYYAKANSGMREENSVSQVMPSGASSVTVDLPDGKYTQLRIDIDGEFRLDTIDISPRDVVRSLSVEMDTDKAIMVFAATAVLLLILLAVQRLSENGESGAEIILIFIIYAFTCFLAMQLLQNDAPDEYIRDDIPLWIFRNHRLPVGNEEELIANPWGFSYGFLPYLPSLLALPFMCLFYAITPTEASLLLATRFISVFSVVGCAVLCLRTGKIIFERKASVYLFLALICFLPQVTFVGAYHNNDSFALFACLLVIYSLLKGRQARWSGKSCVFIGLAFSCCLLSYYNSAGWILLSIPFCVADVYRDRNIGGKLGFISGRAAIIAVSTLILSGGVFVRSAILYDGDFLGMTTQRACAELYAQTGHSVFIPVSPQSQGYSLIDMLFGMQWLIATLKSYVAVFGYMNIYVDSLFYYVYYIILLLGVFFAFASAAGRKKGRLEALLLAAAVTIPAVLSMYRSYTYDFQPQGRYLLPSLPAVALLVACGFERLTVHTSKSPRWYGRSAKIARLITPTSAICALWVLMYVYIYAAVIVPELVFRY